MERPAVVSFSGELDAGDPSFEARLREAVDHGVLRLVVDLHRVTFVDSSVMKSLARAHRQLSDRGGWLRVVYTHHVVRRVIELCGLSSVFQHFPTVEAAWRGAAPSRHHREWFDQEGHPR